MFLAVFGDEDIKFTPNTRKEFDEFLKKNSHRNYDMILNNFKNA